MTIEKTAFEGLIVLHPLVFNDSRGYFTESYNANALLDLGINLDFVQDNQSKSSYGVTRGLHYQLAPKAQDKLIRAIIGKIYDVAVDLRKGSPSYGQWFGIELSDENFNQLLIPKGFAHGFSVLSPNAVVMYKCTNFYHKESERGIRFDDKTLAIDWKIAPGKQVVSDRDVLLPPFDLAEMNFNYPVHD